MGKDNMLSACGGSISSFILMITKSIEIDAMFQVVVYGLIGGAAGILGKFLMQKFIKLFNSKKMKGPKNEE